MSELSDMVSGTKYNRVVAELMEARVQLSKEKESNEHHKYHLDRVKSELADLRERFPSAVAQTRAANVTLEEIVVEVAGRKVADVLACMLRTGLYGSDLETIVREAVQRTAREYLALGLPRPSDGKPKHVPMPRSPIDDPFGGR